MENKTIFEQLDEISEKQDEILDSLNRGGGPKRPSPRPQADPVRESIDKRNQIWSLKNFIARSVHEYMWVGTKEDFYQEKKVALILIIASVLSMIVCTIVATVSFGLYSTYTLFENIWLLVIPNT